MISLFLILICFSLCLFLNPAFAATSMEDTQPIIDSPEDVIGVIIEGTVIFGFFCFLEWLVSIPFKMHEECKKVIILTNIFTQLILHLIEFLFVAMYAEFVGFFFWLTIPILIGIEIMVVIIEFFIYYKKMLGFSTLSIYLYTICANAASLLLGLLIIISTIRGL